VTEIHGALRGCVPAPNVGYGAVMDAAMIAATVNLPVSLLRGDLRGIVHRIKRRGRPAARRGPLALEVEPLSGQTPGHRPEGHLTLIRPLSLRLARGPTGSLRIPPRTQRASAGAVDSGQ
jgi:hypothetical protein